MKHKKHNEGRPPIWTNPAVLNKLIEKYFKKEEKPTLAGLAYALGISRSTLYKYRDKDEFSDTIKKARARIEMVYEKILIYGNRPTGAIFALKNMGWKDKTDITSDEKMLPVPIMGGRAT